MTGSAYQNDFRRGCCFVPDSPYRWPNYFQRKASDGVSGKDSIDDARAYREEATHESITRGVRFTVR